MHIHRIRQIVLLHTVSPEQDDKQYILLFYSQLAHKHTQVQKLLMVNKPFRINFDFYLSIQFSQFYFLRELSDENFCFLLLWFTLIIFIFGLNCLNV